MGLRGTSGECCSSGEVASHLLVLLILGMALHDFSLPSHCHSLVSSSLLASSNVRICIPSNSLRGSFVMRCLVVLFASTLQEPVRTRVTSPELAQWTNSFMCTSLLSLFTAAKITKCGHVFCWSCILHYLALVHKYICACACVCTYVCTYVHIYCMHMCTCNPEAYSV